ncbi:MAG: sulfotransferase, partial [Spirochaetota bacterium]
MKKVDLVFRTIGERTKDVSLQLAIDAISPERVHIQENVKPFSLAVEKSLEIEYKSDFVVFMDADCLVLERIRPFIEQNDYPFVDCFVLDKFRGHIHCGVHITRVDVVNAMKEAVISKYDMRYMLRPESRTRQLALRKLKLKKHFVSFCILHDHGQYYRDIFSKYALRELRSRKPHTQTKLLGWEKEWRAKVDDLDFRVALCAIEYARKNIASDWQFISTTDFINSLSEIGKKECTTLGISEKTEFSKYDLDSLKELGGVKMTQEVVQQKIHKNKTLSGNCKIFGIGLSRTGTKSLTKALRAMGYEITHYPKDRVTYEELVHGFDELTILKSHEGITDITTAAIYPQLDQIYPNSKFILTIRPKEEWLDAMQRHWKGKQIFPEKGFDYLLELRRFLRASVYGCYTYNRKRLSYVY